MLQATRSATRRRTAATILHLAASPRLAWIRYEDLVGDVPALLGSLTDRLGIASLTDGQIRSIFAGSGGDWRGNSSYGELTAVSAASVGRFRDQLPDSVARYLECTCGPEMAALGYGDAPALESSIETIQAFRDPYPIERPDFETDYSSSPQRVAAEVARLRAIQNPGLPGADLFMFDSVRGHLHGSVA